MDLIFVTFCPTFLVSWNKFDGEVFSSDSDNYVYVENIEPRGSGVDKAIETISYFPSKFTYVFLLSVQQTVRDTPLFVVLTGSSHPNGLWSLYGKKWSKR